MLEALADALKLDDAERAHLFDLARAAGPIAPPRRRAGGPSSQRIRPVVQRILDSITAPAAREQRALRLPGRQPPRPRPLRPAVRKPRAAAQQRTLYVPRPRRSRILPRLGESRQGSGGGPAVDGRPQPLRPSSLRSRRRAIDPQRASSAPVTGSAGSSIWEQRLAPGIVRHGAAERKRSWLDLDCGEWRSPRSSTRTTAR